MTNAERIAAAHTKADQAAEHSREARNPDLWGVSPHAYAAGMMVQEARLACWEIRTTGNEKAAEQAEAFAQLAKHLSDRAKFNEAQRRKAEEHRARLEAK